MCAAARIGADEVFTAAYHCDVAGAGLLSAAKILDIVNMPINCCPIVQGEPLCFAVTFWAVKSARCGFRFIVFGKGEQEESGGGYHKAEEEENESAEGKLVFHKDAPFKTRLD